MAAVSVRLQTIRDAIATARYGRHFEPSTGLIDFGPSQGHLRDQWADVEETAFRNRFAAFFLRPIPSYFRGVELACLAEFELGNLKRYAAASFAEGLARWALKPGHGLPARPRPEMPAFGRGSVRSRPRSAALLRRLVEANLPTAFGGDHNFANVTSAESLRDLVPIGDYEALSPYINRVVAGEENVLTAEPVRFLEQTGGSSGGAKYIPYTDTGLQAYPDCLYPWMSDLIRRRPGVTRGQQLFRAEPGRPRRKRARRCAQAGQSGAFCLFRRLARQPDRTFRRADGVAAAHRFRQLAKADLPAPLAAEDWP